MFNLTDGQCGQPVEFSLGKVADPACTLGLLLPLRNPVSLCPQMRTATLVEQSNRFWWACFTLYRDLTARDLMGYSGCWLPLHPH